MEIGCTFNEADAAWFKGSFLVDTCARLRGSLRKEYDQLQDCLASPFKDFSYDEYLWARLATLTRNFDTSFNVRMRTLLQRDSLAVLGIGQCHARAVR